MSLKNEKPKNEVETTRRSAFSARLGAFTVEGNPKAAERLKAAFSVPPMSFSTRLSPRGEQLLSTHLFHSYSARTDPWMVRVLLQEVRPFQVVFDPFVGSGTTLVESSLKGAYGVGVDISELSVRLARFKSTRMSKEIGDLLLSYGAIVEERSKERVRLRKKPKRVWDQPKYYEPHVYLELCGLREEIEQIRTEQPSIYEPLLLVFSSILIKASRQLADSKTELVNRQIGRFQVTRWFVRKIEEVVRLHEMFGSQVPKGTPSPLVFQGDARDLSWKGKKEMLSSADVALTSPPYLGVYDYVEHQMRRYAWLDLDPKQMNQGEMASRRKSKDVPLETLLKNHQNDTNRWMHGVSKVLKKYGCLYVIVGDSFLSGEHVRGDLPIHVAAKEVGFDFVASCTAELVDQSTRWNDESYSRVEHVIQFRWGH